MTDLINDLLDRAEGSLERLKLHYGPLIRYVINPILHDERDREEVFSDILVRVWDRVSAIPAPSKPSRMPSNSSRVRIQNNEREPGSILCSPVFCICLFQKI